MSAHFLRAAVRSSAVVGRAASRTFSMPAQPRVALDQERVIASAVLQSFAQSFEAQAARQVPVPAIAMVDVLEAKINTRKPKRANHGARPCSRYGRRKRAKDERRGTNGKR